jgi:hypothetical protein
VGSGVDWTAVLRRVLLFGLIGGGVTVSIAGCGSAAHRQRPSTDPLLARSECMRAHGVTDFPDPVRVNGSEGFPNTIGRPGENPASPAMRAAEKACAGVGAPLPGV